MIANIELPEWQPVMIYRAIHCNVLLVARTRAEGTWSCYCTPVPGQSHDREIHMWEAHGTKVGEKIARAAFPQFNEIPYDY